MDRQTFATAYRSGNIKVRVDKSIAKKLRGTSTLPTRYVAADYFWQWVAFALFIGSPFAFANGYGIVGVVMIVVGIAIVGSGNQSWSEFLIEYAAVSQPFYDIACRYGLFLVTPTPGGVLAQPVVWARLKTTDTTPKPTGWDLPPPTTAAPPVNPITIDNHFPLNDDNTMMSILKMAHYQDWSTPEKLAYRLIHFCDTYSALLLVAITASEKLPLQDSSADDRPTQIVGLNKAYFVFVVKSYLDAIKTEPMQETWKAIEKVILADQPDVAKSPYAIFRGGVVHTDNPDEQKNIVSYRLAATIAKRLYPERRQEQAFTTIAQLAGIHAASLIKFALWPDIQPTLSQASSDTLHFG
jgi:hypothetical protein